VTGSLPPHFTQQPTQKHSNEKQTNSQTLGENPNAEVGYIVDITSGSDSDEPVSQGLIEIADELGSFRNQLVPVAIFRLEREHSAVQETAQPIIGEHGGGAIAPKHIRRVVEGFLDEYHWSGGGVYTVLDRCVEQGLVEQIDCVHRDHGSCYRLTEQGQQFIEAFGWGGAEPGLPEPGRYDRIQEMGLTEFLRR
jgi:hypothetical protein